jgi:hypothetical protein
MKKINCYSVIGGPKGESLFSHIVYDRDSFNVGDDQFYVNMLGSVETGLTSIKNKGERETLISFNLDDPNCRQGIVPKSIGGSPTKALVFLRGPTLQGDDTNRNRRHTNLRCPLPIEYWKRIGEVERSGSEVNKKKEDIRKEYTFSYDLLSTKSLILLPEERTVNRLSYLVAIAEGGSCEWVLSRKSRYPNTYRLEVIDGQLRLIDPRKEARQ